LQYQVEDRQRAEVLYRVVEPPGPTPCWLPRHSDFVDRAPAVRRAARALLRIGMLRPLVIEGQFLSRQDSLERVELNASVANYRARAGLAGVIDEGERIAEATRVDAPVVVNFDAAYDPLTFRATLGLSPTDALAQKLSDLTSDRKSLCRKAASTADRRFPDLESWSGQYSHCPSGAPAGTWIYPK